MGPIAIRRAARRFRRHAAGVMIVFVVAGGVALHHSDLAMADMHHDGMGPTAVEMCLGAFIAIGTAVVAIAIGIIALGRWRVTPLGPSGDLFASTRPLARARAGPPLLHLLGVLRL